ncbi:LOW QUALITY PROTEIN: methylmalonate-semialdehyde dehydrogenase, partial [Mycobacterium tuberculosis variant africanum K85]
EYTEPAGSAIDVYSLRQALGLPRGSPRSTSRRRFRCGKPARVLACGNPFVLKPTERDPSVPVRLAELFIETGLP